MACLVHYAPPVHSMTGKCHYITELTGAFLALADVGNLLLEHLLDFWESYYHDGC